MPLSTNFNVTPYYDDYDEAKNYYRILFRPGYAVQAREVTQLQTILQKQIERYGQHMFKEGSKVFGGEVSLDTEVKSLKLETQQDAVNINAASFIGTTIIGSSSNARARVVASQATTTSTQPTIMFHYLSGDTFDDGETVAAGTVQAITVSSSGASSITGAGGAGANTNGVVGGDLQKFSGDVIYIENRSPVTRADDQIEDVKLIIEF